MEELAHTPHKCIADCGHCRAESLHVWQQARTSCNAHERPTTPVRLSRPPSSEQMKRPDRVNPLSDGARRKRRT
eukprot:scaffold1018_cov420-Prasinococcus_capsulatus_cf.AAC.13